MIRKTQNCIFIFYTIPIKLLPWIILIIAKQILKKEEFCVKIDIKISELTGQNRKYFHEADEEFQDFMSICDFSYIHVQLLLILCKTKNYRMNDESWLLKKSFNVPFPTNCFLLWSFWFKTWYVLIGISDNISGINFNVKFRDFMSICD